MRSIIRRHLHESFDADELNKLYGQDFKTFNFNKEVQAPLRYLRSKGWRDKSTGVDPYTDGRFVMMHPKSKHVVTFDDNSALDPALNPLKGDDSPNILVRHYGRERYDRSQKKLVQPKIWQGSHERMKDHFDTYKHPPEDEMDDWELS